MAVLNVTGMHVWVTDTAVKFRIWAQIFIFGVKCELQTALLGRGKVKISLLQAMEAHRVARG
jgi:hypothetical protein